MIPEAILMNAAKPAIDNLIKEIITPKIKSFAEKCKIEYNKLLIPRGEHFEEYLYRTYKKYSIINTLVLKNEQKLLVDLYQPLTISEEIHSKKNNTYKIDAYPYELLNKYSSILITDTAGMGKSTLTKRAFLDVIENGYGIPIYIELRRLSKGKTVLMEIQEQVNSLTKEFNPQLLLEFIQIGGFIFFLDGYDEISLNERSFVTSDIQNFISKAGHNVFVMTSRPEQALTSFGDFQMFSINPLTKKEAFELLRRYDNQGITSKQLIEELRSGQYEMINDFLQNPLLVSLLFVAFDYKKAIPLKKHIFYRQVYDAYFDSHDLSKGDHYIHEKFSKLDIDDFERVLLFVGFNCLKLQKIEYEKDALLHIIDAAKSFCPDLDFTTSDYLNDLLSSVPLFCQDGQYYRWMHKSLQEYFAAQFIYKDSKNSQDAILGTLFGSENMDKYLNLLDLYYDIDNWGFKKNIVVPLCEEFVKFYRNSIYASESISKDMIEERIGHLFFKEVCILRTLVPIDKDPFEYVRERGKGKLNGKLTSVTLFHEDNIFLFLSSDPRSKLMPLLAKRQPSLFRTFIRPELIKKDVAEYDKVVTIDVHIGEHCENDYLYYNYYLAKRHSMPSFYFDYNRCIEEMEKIKSVIENKEKTSNLIEGL